jgi:pyruvate kinase
MDEKTIRDMIISGVDAFRLNFSHGKLEEKMKLIKIVRKISKRLNLNIPIIADLQGPVVRIRVDRDTMVYKGREYVFSLKGGVIRIPDNNLFSNIEDDDILLIDDGKLVFRVIEKESNEVIAKALRDGVLHDRKKIFIKDKFVKAEPLTKKDIDDLRFSIENGLEYIALSMVSTPNDIKILRDKIQEFSGDQWIIAKIENPSGVRNIKRIVDVSDGIMIARGDLGQYFPLEKIPEIQHRIAYESIRKGRMTIIATQILESMIDNDTPTRAEVTDIFNSVSERVDAILLTSETAIGRYPVSTVRWAIKILSEADKMHSSEILYYEDGFIENLFDKFARGVIYLSHLINGKILGFTKKGNTARRLARYRPKKKIFVAVQDQRLANKLNILYSITPIFVEINDDYWKILDHAKEYLIRKKLVKKGDTLVYTIGVRPESTDMIRVETI